jgi:SAM-dependent methyltransferase
MTGPNYESKWWGYIYDQMMADGMEDWLADNRRFYFSRLRGVRGPVLDCACGTGLFFLPLLAEGYDVYGFDVSRAMLSTLEEKARAEGLELGDRISVQDFETFHYPRQFDVIQIPTNSFGHLTTQEAQLKALRNIFEHLAPGGRLLFDLLLAGIDNLAESARQVTGSWHTWTHPETGLPIRQRIVERLDLDQQLVIKQCYIEYEGQAEDFPMTGRWYMKDEIQLLLRLAGFERWECYGTPAGDPFKMGLRDTASYWMAYKG